MRVGLPRGLSGKSLPASAGDLSLVPASEDALEEQMATPGKASACSAGDPGWIPGLGRSPGEGNGNSLQCSCLENPMDGGAW